jgi:ribosomal protein S18 acetylase RimI-like enzyme
MDIICSHDWITNSIIKIRANKEGYITNFFMSEERFSLLSKHNLIYSVEYEKCIFILYKDYEFYHIYFLTTDKNQLNKVLVVFVKQYSKCVFVVDLIGVNSFTNELSVVFEHAGFKRYILLYRMVRKESVCVPETLDTKVIFAQLKYSEQIHKLLERYFDKYSEQIPLYEEIAQWITSNSVLIIVEQDKVIGFAIFEINGVTSYLRYWFTHPDYRTQGIGSMLLRRFFYESRNTKRQLFWVISTNENAISRYKHYGFKEEQMFDQVMMKTEMEL